jgi:quinol monooxygenase YgiN
MTTTTTITNTTKRIAMIYLNVFLTVKDAKDVEKVSDLLTQQGKLSRQEPGCKRFEVYHSTADATKFLLSEHWDTQANLDQHRTGKAYTEIYQPQVLPIVTREAHVSTLLQ